MHALIVHAHPETASFNRALTDTAVAAIRSAGHSVEVSDLFEEGFNPVAGRHDFLSVADPDRFHYQSEQDLAARTGSFAPDVRREQDRLRSADLLILQFPLWWGAPPAILKGWLERVLAYGFAYVDGRRFDTGLLKGRRALMCVTTGGTPERFSEAGGYGEIERVLWPVRRLTLDYMGLTVEEPFVCYAAPRVDDAARREYLEQWRCRVLEALASHETMEGRVAADARSLQPVSSARDWSATG
jgi:NAD(P)H dehydrogenase (quinone)